MHFKIKRLKLLNALSKATRAVSVRSTLHVLTGIKFDLKSDQLILQVVIVILQFKQLLIKMMI